MKKILLSLLLTLFIVTPAFADRQPTLSETVIDQTHNRSKGLVAWWIMNGAGGLVAYDSTPYKNNGDFSGGVAWKPSTRGGWSLDFDGADGYVDCGDITAINGATALTVITWVKVDDLTDDGTLISKGPLTAASNLTQFILWRDELAFVSSRTDTFSIFVSDSNNVRLEGANNLSSDNDWHRVGFTFLGGSTTGLSLYVDGVRDIHSPVDVSGVSKISSTSRGNVLIAKPTTTANKELDGQEANVCIYLRELTASEMKQDYINSYAGILKRRYIVKAPTAAPSGIVPFRRRIEGVCGECHPTGWSGRLQFTEEPRNERFIANETCTRQPVSGRILAFRKDTTTADLQGQQADLALALND